MLEQTEGKSPVHFPADPNKFAFDGEVAAIFPDMARRAIPMYEEFHRLHVAMLHGILAASPRVDILDVGASRGEFVNAIKREHGEHALASKRINVVAVDNSAGMCERMAAEHPYISVEQTDILDEGFLYDGRTFDIVVASYIIQFVNPTAQVELIDALMQKLRPGGILIIGHKEFADTALYQMAHEQYIEWRVQNGYTREEIEAKSKALKGSMFPMSHARLLQQLREQMREVQETTRWTVFSTLMARK